MIFSGAVERKPELTCSQTLLPARSTPCTCCLFVFERSGATRPLGGASRTLDERWLRLSRSRNNLLLFLTWFERHWERDTCEYQYKHVGQLKVPAGSVPGEFPSAEPAVQSAHLHLLQPPPQKQFQFHFKVQTFTLKCRFSRGQNTTSRNLQKQDVMFFFCFI